MKDKQSTQRGFLKYIVLFIVLVVLIATFNIDVKAIVEHQYVQDVFGYVRIVFEFIYDTFVQVIEPFQSQVTSTSSAATSSIQ